MKHASLFSGIGGAELAATWMGWRNLFHCEIGEFPRKVLEYWFPNSVSYEDITTTDFTNWRGKVDILTGGFPCQPFSMAGKRLGAEDDRYLWPHMLRAIREIQPTWVVGENVVGLTTMVQPGEEVEVGGQASLFEENYRTREEQTYTIEEICQGLEQAGYSVQPFVVPACAVGAPHRRDRIWIVAHRTDTGVEDVRRRQVDTDEPRAAADAPICGSVACKTDNPAERERRKDDGQQGERREPTKRADGLHTFPFPAADVDSDGQKCRNASGQQETQSRRRLETFCRKASWSDFPTQSPICNGNDGLSLGLVDITFPKWRAESVKALGNAIVPQVIYEIFKAIEEHERI